MIATTFTYNHMTRHEDLWKMPVVEEDEILHILLPCSLHCTTLHATLSSLHEQL